MVKRKITRINLIKKYSPFASAVLATGYPAAFSTGVTETSVAKKSTATVSTKGYGRVRTKLNHKHNN